MSSLSLRENCLLKENGCKIVEATSQRQGSTASNILTSNERCLWLIEKRLPQQCIIDTSALKIYPKVINRIGFYCWHEYESNPSLIEVAYSSSSAQEWIVVGKIRLLQKSGKQYFKLRDIIASEMKQLRITIIQNFGDNCTYLNQVELGFQEEQPPLKPSRDKTFSEFVKLTSTEKELKKAQEQIRRLSIENEEIKQTMLRQGETIIEMQGALRTITKELQKLQRAQEVQSRQLMVHQKDKEIDKIIQRKMNSKLNLGTGSSESNSQFGERKYIEDRLINKKTVNIANKNTSETYAKDNRSCNRKSREGLKNGSTHAKGRTVKQPNQHFLVNSLSDSELSEYVASQHDNNRSKYSEKCSEMMSKLQYLLAQREKRQTALKKQSQASNE